MHRLTTCLATTALAAGLAGPAPADDNPVSNFFRSIERAISDSIDEARSAGWRNEVRGRDDDDDDDDRDDDDERDDREDDDDDDNDREEDDDDGDDD